MTNMLDWGDFKDEHGFVKLLDYFSSERCRLGILHSLMS